MPDRLADLVDGERLLRLPLRDALNVRVGTDVPADLTDPFVQFVRVGGSEDEPSLDLALFDVDVFAPSRGAAWDLARSAHAALRRLQGMSPAYAVDEPPAATVTFVRCVEGFRWAPWDDTNVRRLTGTYQIGLKARTYST